MYKCRIIDLKEMIISFVFLFAALEKLREEFKADSESLVHSEAISILSLCDEWMLNEVLLSNWYDNI